MPRSHLVLRNTLVVDAVPARLMSGRGNATARALAGAVWLVRRKSDGRYLAIVRSDGSVRVLLRGAARAVDARAIERRRCPPALSLRELQRRLRGLGLTPAYGHAEQLVAIAEPRQLSYAGRDRFSRPLWLTADTTRAWQRMRRAAARAGVVLEAISGFRSHAYQLGIFRRKLARGQTLAQILTVNVAPGFSEHHSGRALDIGTPGEPPAEESFESTPAFAWLRDNAARFGFRMSFPRGNPHGVVYEPWHWYYVGPRP